MTRPFHNNDPYTHADTRAPTRAPPPQQTKASFDRSVYIAMQVANGVACLHRYMIVHNDLKAQNVGRQG